MMSDQLYYRIVQRLRPGEADRPSLQPFDTCPEIEVMSLDPQRPAFAHQVACLRYYSAVRRPAVSVKIVYRTLAHLLDQATALLIGPSAIDVGDDSLALSIKPVPSPARPPFRSDK
jgi:hypothetical protein